MNAISERLETNQAENNHQTKEKTKRSNGEWICKTTKQQAGCGCFHPIIYGIILWKQLFDLVK
ncbi:MAG: hypothetical protein AUK35_05615 [Zetaproteobacteria bacterium CG2_30_46_52]|nr:MAG: hypothetical protein AUK35_05615 [Zetaproteobacteria bacterium CG2_30_46_52]